MKIELWLTGKTKASWTKEAMDDFVKRCGRYATTTVKVIAESKSKQPNDIRKDETERIKTLLQKGSKGFTVLLDEKGTQLTSPGLAELISSQQQQGASLIRFIIGGAYGVESSLQHTVDFVLSLSAMTFPHQLVRVLFAEQLYRAFTILRGEGYHHS